VENVVEYELQYGPVGRLADPLIFGAEGFLASLSTEASSKPD
jgi:hypothetical protein